MRPLKSGRFTIQAVTVAEKGCPAYETFRVTGWLHGKRIRKQFISRAEALGEKNALEVEAANAGGEVRARVTRLSVEQLAEAESAFIRLGPRSLSAAVEWFLATYKPPVTEMTLQAAETAFLADRKQHARPSALSDYSYSLRYLRVAFPGKLVHQVTTTDVQTFLAGRGVGKKRFNNLRGDLNAFFNWCIAAPREWARENPVKPIPKFKISRGVPEIITVQTAARLMAYVEHYAGPARSHLAPGCLAPYFALCLFAGLRPDARDGEVRRLSDSENIGKFIVPALGVIRITPEMSKVKSIRQVQIRPNLAAWLRRFPPSEFPIVPPNMEEMIAKVRRKFGLGHDVLRHTFISMHVARFKSLGGAALEAGHSEAMIRKHYLNLVTDADAEKFWSIKPRPAKGINNTKTLAEPAPFPGEPGRRVTQEATAWSK